MPAALLLCLFVLVALGLAERLARDRAWRALSIRVHVNGSRGKSTVTRLVWAALREAGIPALGKTTGTAPRLLLPDGTERAVRRRAPASVREQLAMLRQARRLGARAVVVECMALDPELQWVSEREMVRASLGVITNVRLDHTEIMGASLESIASTLANTIPPSGVLVTGESRCLAVIQERAARAGTDVVSAASAASDLQEWRSRGNAGEVPREVASAPPWLRENMAVALTVTRRLGIADGVALRGFAAAPHDPGAAREGTLQVNGGSIAWLDATAANDPESLRALASAAHAGNTDRGRTVAVYNHRADRSARLACFARESETVARAAGLLVTGDRPPVTVSRRLRRARGDRPIRFVPRRRLAAVLRHEPPGTRLLFCGNTRGLDVDDLLREVTADG